MADKKGGASNKSQGAYGFDPSGLERAAKAAKELDSSPNVKNAFELSLKQEETKATKAKARIKELDISRVQIEQQERRKTLETELQVSKEKSKFDDELARRRYQEQLEQHAEMQEMGRRKDEESVSRQEQMKRQTIQFEQDLKRQNDGERILAKEQAKIQRLLETRDLRRDEMIVKEQERRKTLREVWASNLSAIGSGTKEYLTNFSNLATLAGGLTLAFFGFQFARAAGRITTALVEARVGKPPLVRETSRKTTIGQHFMAPLSSFYTHTLLKGRLLPTSSKQREKDILDGIFINEKLEKDLRTISHSIVNRKRHYAPFRNLLLYGPPGTGKTMFAKSLATHSGMDFAIFTGGDIGPLGKEGAIHLHKLFDWANTSSKGVLLFMDEADAFLRKRSDEHISEDMRNALNAFLFRTGSGSHKFMLVLASNQPEQLDRAAHDRIDEIVHFDKPGHKQRLQMLYHYLLLYCSPPKTVRGRLQQYIKHPRSLVYKKTDIGMKGVEAEFIEEVTKRIEGFSGREIYKLVIAWHDAAFSQANAVLTPEMMKEVLESHIEQHVQRQEWHTRKSVLS